MASSLRPSLLPFCSSCTRRFADHAIGGWRPFQQQVRGKKKMANHSDTLIVRLLRDVKGYGKKGSYVPVPRGMGRNQWIPQRTAEYVPQIQLRTLRLANTPIERDFEFGVDLQADASGRQDIRSIESTIKPSIRLEQLTAERKGELVTIFLPATLSFERPIVGSASPPATGAAASALPIYGSVTTLDIITHIRESLSHNPEASRVKPSDLEIRIVFSASQAKQSGGEEAEEDKIKHLGEYDVEIQVKGTTDVIKRKVRVLPSAEAKA